nr:HlyD family secretion protein [uncultured Pseudomonas sp.]
MNSAVQPTVPNAAEQRSKTTTRRRLALTVALAVTVVALVALANYWWAKGRYLQSTDDAYIKADWVALSSRVAGNVAAVEVEDDQPVKAGDVLVRLHDRDYKARLDQARAGVGQAQAALLAATASQQLAAERIILQGQAILQAQAALRSAKAEARRSQLDVQRYRDLVRDHAATAQRLETATSQASQAQAAEQVAQAALQQQQSQLNMAKLRAAQVDAELKQQRATLSRAEAQQRLAEQDQQDTVIRAPIAGVVGQRRVRAGQYVVPGQPLLAVVPLQQAYVVANYKETQLTHMRPGQPVRIAVDSFADHDLHGHVASLSPASGNVFALLPSDNATGNFTKIVQRFPVRILLDQPLPDLPILPGMSVVTQVDTRPGATPDEH